MNTHELQEAQKQLNRAVFAAESKKQQAVRLRATLRDHLSQLKKQLQSESPNTADGPNDTGHANVSNASGSAVPRIDKFAEGKRPLTPDELIKVRERREAVRLKQEAEQEARRAAQQALDAAVRAAVKAAEERIAAAEIACTQMLEQASAYETQIRELKQEIERQKVSREQKQSRRTADESPMSDCSPGGFEWSDSSNLPPWT